MGIIPLTVIDRKYSWQERQRKVEILDLGDINVKDKNILLATAEPYTGETLRKGYEYLKSKHPKDIKTALLYKSEVTQFIPDYYAYEIKK